MYVIRARNVNGAFAQGLRYLSEVGIREESRAGPVVVVPSPVITVYEKPMERVLLDPKRDANPLFHLYESLWMLAGRNDAASLNRYVRDFGERFAEPDGVIHDAYGHRWRTALGFDQLDHIVGMLHENHGTRQAVLQMWDARRGCRAGECDDGSSNDLLGDWQGRPCNTHVYFRVRNEKVGTTTFDLEPIVEKTLDMTILCRSNDIVWGAYGANAVHFSMLMEYVAGRVGMQVGTMYQFSNNWHAYVDALDRLGDPSRLAQDDPYETRIVTGSQLRAVPMGTRWNYWDSDLALFMGWHDLGCEAFTPAFANSWFAEVACPMCAANDQHRKGNIAEALRIIDLVQARDWHRAGRAWLLRRLQKRAEKESVGDVR